MQNRDSEPQNGRSRWRGTEQKQWKIARNLKNARDLRDHISGTYYSLRIGIVIVAIALPLVLWWIGALVFSLALQGSMSAYYHTPMRNVFVGASWAIGSFLYLYKGYGNRENIALNIAGVSSIFVALLPLDWSPSWLKLNWINPHGFFAMLFFACIGYVCVFRASDTLGLSRDRDVKARYRNIYRYLGVAMWVVPALIWFLVQVWGFSPFRDSSIFFLEALAIWIFGTYWIFKSIEIQTYTKAEEKTINLQARKKANEVEPEPNSEEFHREAVQEASSPAPPLASSHRI